MTGGVAQFSAFVPKLSVSLWCDVLQCVRCHRKHSGSSSSCRKPKRHVSANYRQVALLYTLCIPLLSCCHLHFILIC